MQQLTSARCRAAAASAASPSLRSQALAQYSAMYLATCTGDVRQGRALPDGSCPGGRYDAASSGTADRQTWWQAERCTLLFWSGQLADRRLLTDSPCLWPLANAQASAPAARCRHQSTWQRRPWRRRPWRRRRSGRDPNAPGRAPETPQLSAGSVDKWDGCQRAAMARCQLVLARGSPVSDLRTSCCSVASSSSLERRDSSAASAAGGRKPPGRFGAICEPEHGSVELGLNWHEN